MPRGGARPGAGRPPKSAREHRRDRTKPHPPTTAPLAEKLERLRIHPLGVSWAGRPAGYEIMSAVEHVWTDELEQAWSGDDRHETAKMAAENAIETLYAEWRRLDGPEWAAAQGYDVALIVGEFLRAPDREDSSFTLPPSLETVAGLLVDGRLLAWQRGELQLDDDTLGGC